jgi:hypothetical protein
MMKCNESTKGVRLSSEDQRRMIRLREEILGRVNEMGLIINRTLDRPVTASIGKFDLIDTGAGPKKGEVEYWLDGKLVAVGCWDEEAQECYPGPCPE